MEPILPAENVSHATQFKHGITTRYPNKCCRRISSGVLTTLMAHTTLHSFSVDYLDLLQEQTVDDKGLDSDV